MIKRYIFFVLTVVAIVIGGCKKKPAPIVITPDIEKTHLERNHIFGKVRWVASATCYLYTDSIPLKDTADLKVLFDGRTFDAGSLQLYTADGWLRSFAKLNEKQEVVLRREYTYDDEAKITRWEEYDADSTWVTYGTYSYDRNGFLVGEQVYQGDSLVISFAHTTDGIGNAIRTVQSFGKLHTTTENKFNEQGLVTQITEYEPDGKVFKTAKIEYDNYGDEVNRCVYKAGNQMIEYTYTEYAQDGRVRKVIYEDKLHHVKEFHYYFDYDANKNWQTEVCAVDNQIVYVKTRTFEYYE